MASNPAVNSAELLVGTRKGLFVLRGPRGGPMEIAHRLFPGEVVEYAMRDRRSGRYFASVTNGQFGPHVYAADDAGGEWSETEGPTFPADTGATLERTWIVAPGVEDNVLWAGVQPAALFRSEDGGRSWQLVRGLWDEPTRERWEPGAGGLCLHSICPWPGEPERLAVGISSAGVWLTEDGGRRWRRGVRGLVPRYIPEAARENAISLCVHNMHRSPAPTRLYMQFHGGVYRSDDAGESWVDIGFPGCGLPSDFGFPLVADPRDAERALVIPLISDEDRVTPGGQVRVYETRDHGGCWRQRGDGLPERDAYLTVLRQAFCHDGDEPLGLYFGAEQGEVFGSDDDGATWKLVAANLPPVSSVRVA